jgi:hypothetical protein
MDKCTQLAMDMSEVVLRSLSLADFDEYAKDNDDPGIFEDAEDSIDSISDIVGKLSLTRNDADFLKDRIKNVKEAISIKPVNHQYLTHENYASNISLNGYELARVALAQCTRLE